MNDSFDKPWQFSANVDNQKIKVCNEQIRITSGDQFYKLVFEVDDAFKQVVNVLPRALDDFVQHNVSLNNGSLGLFGEITNKMRDGGYESTFDMINQDTFSKYIGF